MLLHDFHLILLGLHSVLLPSRSFHTTFQSNSHPLLFPWLLLIPIPSHFLRCCCVHSSSTFICLAILFFFVPFEFFATLHFSCLILFYSYHVPFLITIHSNSHHSSSSFSFWLHQFLISNSFPCWCLHCSSKLVHLTFFFFLILNHLYQFYTFRGSLFYYHPVPFQSLFILARVIFLPVSCHFDFSNFLFTVHARVIMFLIHFQVPTCPSYILFLSCHYSTYFHVALFISHFVLPISWSFLPLSIPALIFFVTIPSHFDFINFVFLVLVLLLFKFLFQIYLSYILLLSGTHSICVL